MTKSDLFTECIRNIDAAYKELRHTLDWRFLSVSKTVLDKPVKIALITMNPGGKDAPPDHPRESCENGVSYLVERWHGYPPGQAPLQIQVQRLFAMIKDVSKYPSSYQQLMAESLISHYIPFRSPEYKLLPKQKESLAFGRELWTRILPIAAPDIVICLGKEIKDELRVLIPDALSVTLVNSREYILRWQNRKVLLNKYAGPLGEVRLLALPHLSRCKIFSNAACIRQMHEILTEACHNLRLSI